MYIHQLAIRTRRRQLPPPSVAAGVLAVLGACNPALHVPELPLPIQPRPLSADELCMRPPAPHGAMSGRKDSPGTLRVSDGPEGDRSQLAPLAAQPMPASRGMQYTMQQAEAYLPTAGYAAIFASLPQYGSAALLAAADELAAGGACQVASAPSTVRGPEGEKHQAAATEGPEGGQPSLADANTAIAPDSGALSMSHHPNFLRAPPGLWKG